MAQDNERRAGDAMADEATQLKKRARRRLIGAAALALLAAIVLPMVMDHQPAPPLKDIQVRIPSPDEGGVLRSTPAAARQEKPAPAAEPPAMPISKSAEAAKPEPKPEPRPDENKEAKRAKEVLAGKPADEEWEVQLGAYQNPGSVTNLVAKLKQLGVPTYTEKIDTPNGPRTRVRAGPFSSQEEAEKARTRVKIIGVDGPVAKKP
jgi:DedD protein